MAEVPLFPTALSTERYLMSASQRLCSIGSWQETFLVQKLVRATFGNNNVDTCARVCHSPTGYGLSTTFGTSAGTQDFDSVEHSDVMIVLGANPTDAHPVFASRMRSGCARERN